MEIIILMDGTWNEPEYELQNSEFPQGDATNIERLEKLLVKDNSQSIIYLRGIGTDGKQINKVIDGAYGRSAQGKVDDAYQRIRDQFSPGDTLSIFGFSRGAATSRMLAQKINRDGINDSSVNINFMGLFDTVAALGMPDTNLDWEGFKKVFDDKQKMLRIPKNVERVVHLVAIDEDRAPFLPTLLSIEDALITDAHEVWFAGNHGDIGGGWKAETEVDPRHTMWHITLRYIIEQAQVTGINFDPEWEQHVPPNPLAIGTIHELAQSFRDPKTLLGGKVERHLDVFPGNTKAFVHESVEIKHKREGGEYSPAQFRNGFVGVNLISTNSQ